MITASRPTTAMTATQATPTSSPWSDAAGAAYAAETASETTLGAAGLVGSCWGGVTVTRSLFGPQTRSRLFAEAVQQWRHAELQENLVDDRHPGRGGQPLRRLWSASGGVVQDRAYLDPAVSARLSSLTGMAIRPAGNRGSYSYYTASNQFLGLHRDVPTCDLTVITVLHDDSAGKDPHGGLLCYPDRCHQTLSTIRANPEPGARIVKAPAGSTIVLAGGEVAHRLLPVAPGAQRIISVLCFEALG